MYFRPAFAHSTHNWRAMSGMSLEKTNKLRSISAKSDSIVVFKGHHRLPSVGTTSSSLKPQRIRYKSDLSSVRPVFDAPKGATDPGFSSLPTKINIPSSLHESPESLPQRLWNIGSNVLSHFAARTPGISGTSRNTEAPLYSGHIHTSLFQKLALMIGSSVIALSNPERADMVAVLGETSGLIALGQMHSKMLSDPVGRNIMETKPRINSNNVNIEKMLTDLPEGTLGHDYALWMHRHGYSSNERPAVRFVDDAELAYVMTRYREVHDFWHILSGLDTSVEEELALKIFEFLHTGLPMAALGSLIGPITLSQQQRSKILHVYLPWALKNQSSCKFLLNVKYEELLDQKTEDVRKMLGFIPASSQTL